LAGLRFSLLFETLAMPIAAALAHAACLEFTGLLTQNASCSKKAEGASFPLAQDPFGQRSDSNMSIETAEKLKAQLTDKYVVVKHGVAELKRFESLTGVVKTVNMSGRALVQFDGPVDISWYDIDPQYLSVVEAPAKKAAAEKHAGTKEAAGKAAPAPAAAGKPAAAKPAGMSPLEMARAQGAGKAPAAKSPTAQAPAAAGTAPAAGAQLSPLELARQQGALKAGGTAPAAKPAAPAKAEGAPAATPQAEAAPAPAQPAKKMSPLEIARMQGAAKEGCLTAPSATPTAAATAPTPAAAAPPTPSPAPPAAAPAGGKKLSPLELARQQGAFKGNG
jgi:hypothetical protein